MDENKINEEYLSDEALKKRIAEFRKRLEATGNRSLMDDFSSLNDSVETALSEKNGLIDSDELIPSIKNRRGLETALKSEIARANRANYGLKPEEPLRYLFSLIEVDFNDFKPVNDTYGHLEGDNLVRLFVSSYKKIMLRTEDIIGRWSKGDEFMIILPHPILPGRSPKKASPKNVISRVFLPSRDIFYKESNKPN